MNLYIPPTPQTDSTCDDEWAAAAAALKGIGLGTWREAVCEAQARGQTPADVLAAVETYDANRAKLTSAGAVRSYLDCGAWPAEGVTSPADVTRRRAEREEADARRIAGYRRVERDTAAEDEALEHDHGAALDALPDHERDALAAAVLRDRTSLELYRAGRWRERSMPRLLLLAALQSQAAVSSS
ncbi:MAG: hypothetical protein QM775_16580 [Pirellulales bacterium]